MTPGVVEQQVPRREVLLPPDPRFRGQGGVGRHRSCPPSGSGDHHRGGHRLRRRHHGIGTRLPVDRSDEQGRQAGRGPGARELVAPPSWGDQRGGRHRVDARRFLGADRRDDHECGRVNGRDERGGVLRPSRPSRWQPHRDREDRRGREGISRIRAVRRMPADPGPEASAGGGGRSRSSGSFSSRCSSSRSSSS